MISPGSGFHAENGPSAASLLGILRISAKHGMSNARTWSIQKLQTKFPVNPDELYNPNHFPDPRTENNVVELIETSLLCDTPEFLPYAYYAIASSD